MRSFGLLIGIVLVLHACSDEARSDFFGTGSNQFEIEFVTIGNPGNQPDRTGIPNPAGGVDYVYNMAKYEVSRRMIDKANAETELNLTMAPMAFMDGGPRPDMAVTGVSWNEAARFVNWLNTSKGYPEAYKFAEEVGSENYVPNTNILLWEPADPGYNADNPFRNSLAHYVLPNSDEWYKAAYYDPTRFDGEGGYWNYPTGSNEVPISVSSGTEQGTAVHSQRLSHGPADITQAGGLSPYGIMAMGGNAWEWEETELDLVNDNPDGIRGVRGGRWFNFGTTLNVFNRDDDDPPWHKENEIGFRIASIPVPESEIDFVVTPGTGLFEAGDESFLTVDEIENGFRIRAKQVGSDLLRLDPFELEWETQTGQWYRIESTLDLFTTNSDGLTARDVFVDPESGFLFGSRVLTPATEPGTISFNWEFDGLESVDDMFDVEWEVTAVPMDAPMNGDANGDGDVDFFDFLTVSREFNSTDSSWYRGDFNFDGQTDFGDFLILSRKFGQSASSQAAAVPEPTSATMASICVLCLTLLGRRRRRAG